MRNTLELDSFTCLCALRQLFEKAEIPDNQLDKYSQNLTAFYELISMEAAVSAATVGEHISIDSTTQDLLSKYGYSAKYLNGAENSLTPDQQMDLILDIKKANQKISEKDGIVDTKSLVDFHKTATSSLGSKTGFRKSGSPDSINSIKDLKYPTAAKIEKELEGFFADLKEKLDQKEGNENNAFTTAGWIYAKFLAISPFSSGNEIIAHLLASHILHLEGYLPIIPVSNNTEAFQDAVSNAIADDPAPFVELLIQSQIQIYLRAIQINQASIEDEKESKVLDAFLNLPRELEEVDEEGMEKARALVDELWQTSIDEFNESADTYNTHQEAENPEFSFVDFASNEDQDRKHWYLFQVIRAASNFNYWASPELFHYWVKLGYTTNNARYEIFLSFHAIGKEFNGKVAATLCSYKREVGAKRIINFHTICDKPFVISPELDFDDLRNKFADWLKKGQDKGYAMAKLEES